MFTTRANAVSSFNSCSVNSQPLLKPLLWGEGPLWLWALEKPPALKRTFCFQILKSFTYFSFLMGHILAFQDPDSPNWIRIPESGFQNPDPVRIRFRNTVGFLLHGMPVDLWTYNLLLRSSFNYQIWRSRYITSLDYRFRMVYYYNFLFIPHSFTCIELKFDYLIFCSIDALKNLALPKSFEKKLARNNITMWEASLTKWQHYWQKYNIQDVIIIKNAGGNTWRNMNITV